MTTEVGKHVVDAEGHLFDLAVLNDFAVDVGSECRCSNIHPSNDSGTYGTETVHPLDPCHAAAIGVSIVVAANIVGRGEARHVVPGLFGRNVPHRLADDGRDLTLVVEILAIPWAMKHPAM